MHLRVHRTQGDVIGCITSTGKDCVTKVDLLQLFIHQFPFGVGESTEICINIYALVSLAVRKNNVFNAVVAHSSEKGARSNLLECIKVWQFHGLCNYLAWKPFLLLLNDAFDRYQKLINLHRYRPLACS